MLKMCLAGSDRLRFADNLRKILCLVAIHGEQWNAGQCHDERMFIPVPCEVDADFFEIWTSVREGVPEAFSNAGACIKGRATYSSIVT
jgi:hypothetical protein